MVTLTPRLKCSQCGRELQEGEFMAIIGSAPASGLSMPVGRADKIIDDLGDIYCRRCFEENYVPQAN